MELRRDLDSLRRSVAALWALLLLAALVGAYFVLTGHIFEITHTLRCTSEGQDLRLSASSDGPFVVFGFWCPEEKRVATLPRPLLITDSAGAIVSAKELKWQDIRGESTQPPTSSSITALYVRSEPAELSKTGD